MPLTDHIVFDDGAKALILLDQRLLPGREERFACRTTEDVVYALKTMVVRGAPAIGVAAAYGCWLALEELGDGPDWGRKLAGRLETLENARPTAVNLRWAVERMRRRWDPAMDFASLSAAWLAEAKAVHSEDIEINRAMGLHGAALIEDGDTVMTHCNAGALATAGFGTALGVIYAAVEQGKRIKVIANETRPFLQGARLTAYELARAGVDVTVACDNACGLLMRRGLVHKIVVGADRVAANGDVANKIGTYVVACMAKRHNVPFYVAAPLSTIDPATASGADILIEDRTPDEVTHVGETRITPHGVPVFNFAFDVTPGDELVSGIVTEQGVLLPSYSQAIARLFG